MLLKSDCGIGNFGEIPYAKEQGTSRGITGKIVSTAGNLPSLPPKSGPTDVRLEWSIDVLLFGGVADLKNQLGNWAQSKFDCALIQRMFYLRQTRYP